MKLLLALLEYCDYSVCSLGLKKILYTGFIFSRKETLWQVILQIVYVSRFKRKIPR